VVHVSYELVTDVTRKLFSNQWTCHNCGELETTRDFTVSVSVVFASVYCWLTKSYHVHAVRLHVLLCIILDQSVNQSTGIFGVSYKARTDSLKLPAQRNETETKRF